MTSDRGTMDLLCRNIWRSQQMYRDTYRVSENLDDTVYRIEYSMRYTPLMISKELATKKV